MWTWPCRIPHCGDEAITVRTERSERVAVCRRHMEEIDTETMWSTVCIRCGSQTAVPVRRIAHVIAMLAQGTLCERCYRRQEDVRGYSES